MNILAFLALSFGISLVAFACITALPAARSPESAFGLPFWLIMVWGPSLAAMVLSAREGQLAELLGRVVQLSSVPWPVWALVAAPVALLLVLLPFAPEATTALSPGLVLGLVAFNLVLGPLGEELGWRGYLQDRLAPELGWLVASLVVGGIWLVWHLPLWTIDSPHAQIALPLFAGHVLCYAVIIGAGHTLSGGSILPAVLIHLSVNVASGLAIFAGFRDPNSWFGTSLWFYAVLSLLAIGLVVHRTGQAGAGWLGS
ncbi:CPBP family intramembrane metalloprotease [Primorskyibacter aestuariivivens]|uniref:CPBP family intramembrane glutamic endopeptidase n=1 Tax=Primorskyibacter aestuariivivens TaxID=1888912 RepID=UPI0022FFEBE0|nr:CPBP family intramembrane glutamic endopeptidase [Primorskyibacter aestuariivivens]MDA7427207.1 CPBP family intramembrane metalloprotease [Primorskyibacter aestuariivivens]